MYKLHKNIFIERFWDENVFFFWKLIKNFTKNKKMTKTGRRNVQGNMFEIIENIQQHTLLFNDN